MPFGALITTIIRNVVGIGTFGTFSPALLAMSFIYANWQTGVAILLIVIMAGVVSRSFLERLRLLAVPRLSIILTIVILCVVFGMSILYYLLPEIVTDAVLLPMVILTMLIERFYVTTEEDGLMYTVKLAAGTLMVAVAGLRDPGLERSRTVRARLSRVAPVHDRRLHRARPLRRLPHHRAVAVPRPGRPTVRNTP